ncbi:MAG: GNAT family N-acetyltransferase [Armatimonadia bacterium]
MDYRLVTHREVPRLPEQLASLSNLAFAEYEGAPEVDAAFCDWYGRRPGSSLDVCVGALYGDTLVANVLVAIQEVNVGGEFIPCGIVDTVATHPEHRKHGLAHRLMDMAHEIMRRRKVEAAVLYTNPENHPYHFYGRLGYVARARAGMLTGERPTAQGAYQVRPMGEGEEGTVRDLVNARYSRYEGFARLDEALWQWHRVERPASMPAEVVVAEQDGRIVGTVALAEVDVLLAGQRERVTVLSDAVYPDTGCLRDMLAASRQAKTMALHGLLNPEKDDLEELGFVTQVGEVSMVLPFSKRAQALLREPQGPWYVMVESVVGV